MTFWDDFKGGEGRVEFLCSIGGSSNPRVAVRRLAESTLAQCVITAPPVCLEKLCELRNVRAVEMYLTGCDARLLGTPHGYIAEINAGHPESRRRFSICHELGHTFFEPRPGMTRNMNDVISRCYEQDLEEKLCDMFAAEFLMPQNVFSFFAKDLSPGITSLRRISSAFHVSAQSAALRIIDLDLWPVGLLMLQYNAKEQPLYRGYRPSRSVKLNVPVSAVIRAFRSPCSPTGTLVVPNRNADTRVEYYTYMSSGRTNVCALMFTNNPSA